MGAGRKLRRSRGLRARAEDALNGGGLGLPRDPVAERAAELGNRVIAEALARGETEDAAYDAGMRAGVDFYLNAPPEDSYGY